jgi:hypothetical protein
MIAIKHKGKKLVRFLGIPLFPVLRGHEDLSAVSLFPFFIPAPPTAGALVQFTQLIDAFLRDVAETKPAVSPLNHGPERELEAHQPASAVVVLGDLRHEDHEELGCIYRCGSL